MVLMIEFHQGLWHQKLVSLGYCAALFAFSYV